MKSNQTRLGISTYCYYFACAGNRAYAPKRLITKNPWTISDLVDRAAELGVACVQVSDNFPLLSLSGAELEWLGQYAADRQIGLETGMRGIMPEQFARYLEISHKLGAPMLRCVTDCGGFQPDMDEIYRIICSMLPRLEAYNIILGIENHDRFPTAQFAGLVRRLDSPNVGMIVDTVNSFATLENPRQVVETLAPCAVGLHIKDFTIARRKECQGLVVKGAPAGKGMLDIPYVLDMMKRQARGDFSTVLESWMEPLEDCASTLAQEDRWVGESIAYLKSCL